MRWRVIISLISMFLLTIVSHAQSYQSSFAAPKYDRLKGPSSLSEVVGVDTETGAALINLPMGPGLGTRGASFQPALRGRHAAQRIETPNGFSYNSGGWFGISPGYLKFSGIYLLGTYEGPSGEIERFGLLTSRVSGLNLPSILAAFGYTNSSVTTYPLLSAAIGLNPVTNAYQTDIVTQLPSPGPGVTDSGALVIPISTQALPTLLLSSPGAASGDVWSTYQVPQCVLVVKEDASYEYSYINHSWAAYGSDGGSDPSGGGGDQAVNFADLGDEWQTIDYSGRVIGPGSNLLVENHILPGDIVGIAGGAIPPPVLSEVDYVLTRITNRFGESIRFTYPTGSNGIDYTAEWYRGETSTGFKIHQQLIAKTGTGGALDTHFQVKLSYDGISSSAFIINMDQTSVKTGLRDSTWWVNRGTNIAPVRGVQSPDGLGGLTDPIRYSRVTSVTPESIPSEAVNFNWEQIESTDYYGSRLKSVSLPGREVRFEWTPYEYRENEAADLCLGFHSSKIDPSSYHKTAAYAITRMDDQDLGSGNIRTTKYIRKTPIPDWTKDNAWFNSDSSTTMIEPDGRQVFLRYMNAPTYDSAVEGYLLGGGYSSAEKQVQTLAFLKGVLMEERHYSPGIDWQSDVGKTPEQSQADRVVLYDRLTLRSISNPRGLISSSSHPISTRVRDSDLLNQVMVQHELVNWNETDRGWQADQELRYGSIPQGMVTEIRSLADTLQTPANPVPVLQRQKDLQHLTNLTVWLLGENTRIDSSTISDTTGSMIGTSSLPFQASRENKIIDSMNRIAEIQLGYASQVKATYNYLNTGPDGALAQNVNLTGPFAQSGSIGASYEYDHSTGFLNTIRPAAENLALMVQQQLDGAGRPISQTGMDGLVTGIQWDPLGRLSIISPPGNEAITTRSVDTDGLGVVLQRGSEKSQFRYNAFGNLVLERHWDANGVAKHRLYGYDSVGRQTWSTVWRPGLGNEYGWSNTLAPDDMINPAWTEVTEECLSWTTQRINGVYTKVCSQYLTIEHPSTISYVGSTHITYDPQGRVVQVIDPNGSVTQTAYVGRIRIVTDGMLWDGTQAAATSSTRRMIYEQDADGRLKRVVDSMNHVTEYFYDGAGRIAEVDQYPTSTGSGNSWVGFGSPQRRYWLYNSLGWLVLLDQPESGVTYYSSFNVLGKPLETIYGLPRGWRPASLESRDNSAASAVGVRVINSKYDSMGRITRTWSNDASVDHSLYYGWPGDPAQNVGKLTRATTTAGVARELNYDPGNGRLASLTRIVDGISYSISLFYDPTYGRLIKRAYPDGRAQVVDYEQALGIPISTGFGPSGTPDSLATMWYDPTSEALTQVNYSNSASSSFSYGGDQVRLSSSTISIPGKLAKTWNYSYNSLGQLASDAEDWYGYDLLGRLTIAYSRDPFNTVSNQGILQKISYDSFGNRLSLDSKIITNWSPGSAPPATPTTTAITDPRLKDLQTYSFDTSNSSLLNRNQLPETALNGAHTGAYYDYQGNLKNVYRVFSDSSTQINLSYDALGRVIGLGDNVNPNNQTYSYDDEGLRIKIYDSKTDLTTYNIYNEARQLLATYTKTSGGVPTWKRDIIYVGTKEMAEYDGTGMGITLVDHLGSPRYGWKGGQNPLSKQKYLPFGEAINDIISTGSFAKGFTNHEQTDPSGLIYMQARFYAPWYGRFLSPDPARDQHFEETQSWNIYSYVRNNPVMLVDPTGMIVPDDGKDKKAPVAAGLTGVMTADSMSASAGTDALIGILAPALPYVFAIFQISDATPKFHHETDTKSGEKTGTAESDHKTGTVEDALKDTKPVREGKKSPKSDQREATDGKPGMDGANDKFDSLRPKDVVDKGEGVRTGKLDDGTRVTVRPKSEPTVELQRPQVKRPIKIRFPTPNN